MSHLMKSALVISAVMTPFALSGCSGDSDATATTITSTVTVPAPASTTLLREGLDFKICSDGISAIGSLVTSCEFATEVRQAYLDTRDNNLSVMSPVMHAFYPMHCTTGYTVNSRDAVKCVEQGGWDGSDDAIVIVLL